MSTRTLQSRVSSRGGARPAGRSVLLVADAAAAQGMVQELVAKSGPGARVEVSRDWFEAIGELTQRAYDAVIAPATPIARRANSAVEALRGVAGDTRLILLAQPAEEGLCRRLMGVGCDEYLIWPASANELAEALVPPAAPAASASSTPPPSAAPTEDAPFVRGVATPLHSGPPQAEKGEPRSVIYGVNHGGNHGTGHGTGHGGPVAPFTLAGLAVAEIFLECLEREPGTAARAGLRELNARLPAGARFELAAPGGSDPVAPAGMVVLSHLLRSSSPAGAGVLHLLVSKALDEQAATALLDQVAPQLARVLELQDRHQRLQKLAITDDLTGLYNCRYFKHFLERVLERARQQMAPVTLLLFDIDGFKKYNDQFGHAAGDEILIQTGKMMRRCVRDHDLVARLGGDEFAVVFWEKEGPRQAIAKEGAGVSGQRMQDAVQKIFERFQAMVASHDFQALGPTGRGQLTISGGLAVYPWAGTTAQAMIDAADHALMFGAKRSGKNSVHLVGGEEFRPGAQRSPESSV